MLKVMLNLSSLHKMQVPNLHPHFRVNTSIHLLMVNIRDIVDVNVFNVVVRQLVQAVLERLVLQLVARQKAQLEQAHINNIPPKGQVIVHLQVGLVVNDDKVVFEDRSFDYLINLKGKCVKYAVVY
jgi:hypothetical protein